MAIFMRHIGVVKTIKRYTQNHLTPAICSLINPLLWKQKDAISRQ